MLRAVSTTALHPDAILEPVWISLTARVTLQGAEFSLGPRASKGQEWNCVPL